jgi:hypothetical protein
VVHHDFFGRISPLTEPSRDGTMVAVDGRWFPGIHGLDSSQEYPLHRFLTLVPGWGMGSRKNTPWWPEKTLEHGGSGIMNNSPQGIFIHIHPFPLILPSGDLT